MLKIKKTLEILTGKLPVTILSSMKAKYLKKVLNPIFQINHSFKIGPCLLLNSWHPRHSHAISCFENFVLMQYVAVLYSQRERSVPCKFEECFKIHFHAWMTIHILFCYLLLCYSNIALLFTVKAEEAYHVNSKNISKLICTFG